MPDIRTPERSLHIRNAPGSSDYPEQISNLEGTINDLNVQKQKYEQLSGFSSPEEGSIYETEKFDISYLWTTIGEYASKEGITLAMDVKRGTGTDLYNLDFTVQGTYTHLSTFITTIENDSRNIVEGSMFFAIKGFSTDGVQFIPSAIEKGAKVILVDDIKIYDTEGKKYQQFNIYNYKTGEKMNGTNGENNKKMQQK